LRILVQRNDSRTSKMTLKSIMTLSNGIRDIY
jgi:hypothetical protein